MVLEVIIPIAIILFIIWWIYDYKKQNTIHIDSRGYERDGYGTLVHRKVAYRYLFKGWGDRGPFGNFDVHHKDGNKRNNHPDNLEILTREEHDKKHKKKYHSKYYL